MSTPNTNLEKMTVGGLALTRMGYGAMQLAGPGVWGPPRDPEAAVAVLREVVASGITHIDTSDFYGPHTVNKLIRTALAPYPDDLVIVTKVGARRGDDKSWIMALSPEELKSAVHDNLDNLGVERLDVVNLRVGHVEGPAPGSIAKQFTALAELQQQGLIHHLGLSNVTAEQLAECQAIAPVVCVQQYYNVAHREDEALLQSCAAQGIAYVPFFPLGGFNPLQSQTLADCAQQAGISQIQLALAWLLQHSPNILLIPGTSSLEHLRENIAAAQVQLPAEIITKLDGIGAASSE